MADEARIVSIQPQQKQLLVECSWEEIREPGTYVEKRSAAISFPALILPCPK